MAGTTGSKTTGRKKTTNRPNRAQLRAMEVRRSETAPSVGATAITPSGAVAVNRRTVNRAVARPLGLTRAQEMAYVRSDLRRLLYIAGGLFVLMIALLLLLD
jgi:hypothetical protein